MTFLLGCGVLFGTNLTTDDARSSVKAVGDVAPIGCRASTSTAAETGGDYNIGVSESVQVKAKEGSCAPVANTAKASTSAYTAATLASFIENLQYSISGPEANDKPASSKPANCKPQNCKPADCKPINCDPSNCDPENCDVSKCKPANCKPSC